MRSLELEASPQLRSRCDGVLVALRAKLSRAPTHRFRPARRHFGTYDSETRVFRATAATFAILSNVLMKTFCHSTRCERGSVMHFAGAFVRPSAF